MCGDAFYYGFIAGAALGGVAACALCWDHLRRACKALREYHEMRALLFNLQTAEGRYRQRFDTLGEMHRDTIEAWDDMRTAGNAARAYLFWQDAAQ